MDGTAIFDIPRWGRPFYSYNVTQTHSIFLKTLKVSVVMLDLSIGWLKNNFTDLKLDLIEKYEIDGDFIESQAFAYLAIRSYEGMPISFPTTTRCKKPSTGGTIVKNF